MQREERARARGRAGGSEYERENGSERMSEREGEEGGRKKGAHTHTLHLQRAKPGGGKEKAGLRFVLAPSGGASLEMCSARAGGTALGSRCRSAGEREGETGRGEA